MTRLRVLALAVLAAGGLATACTSSGSGSAPEAPPMSVGSSDTGSSGASAPAPASDTATDSSAAPTTPATSSAAPSRSASHTVAGPPACAFGALTIGVIRGGAVAGQELAAVTFTNSSKATCSMYGFPGVSLLLNGRQLGQPADRSAKKPTTVSLNPGDTAQAQITVFSSCNAPLSDALRVYPPDQTRFGDRPIQLRGCRMAVDPVGPPA